MTNLIDGLQRVQEALEEAIKSHDNLYMAHFNNQEMCDHDLAIIPAKQALALLPSLIEQAKGMDKALRFLNSIAENPSDPNEPIADNGATVWEYYRWEARIIAELLSTPQPPKEG